MAVAEKQEADDDDGSQSVYSEFEDDGAEEAEEEGEEEQQYSEFEDEPKVCPATAFFNRFQQKPACRRCGKWKNGTCGPAKEVKADAFLVGMQQPMEEQRAGSAQLREKYHRRVT